MNIKILKHFIKVNFFLLVTITITNAKQPYYNYIKYNEIPIPKPFHSLKVRYEGNHLITGTAFNKNKIYLFSHHLKTKKWNITHFDNSQFKIGDQIKYLHKNGQFLVIIHNKSKSTDVKEKDFSTVSSYLVNGKKHILTMKSAKAKFENFKDYKDFIFYQGGGTHFISNFNSNKMISLGDFDSDTLRSYHIQKVDLLTPQKVLFTSNPNQKKIARFTLNKPTYNPEDSPYPIPTYYNINFPNEIEFNNKKYLSDDFNVICSNQEGTVVLIHVVYSHHNNSVYIYKDKYYCFNLKNKQIKELSIPNLSNLDFISNQLLRQKKDIYYFEPNSSSILKKLTSLPIGYFLKQYSFNSESLRINQPLLYAYKNNTGKLFIYGQGWKDIKTYLANRGISKSILSSLQYKNSTLDFFSNSGAYINITKDNSILVILFN